MFSYRLRLMKTVFLFVLFSISSFCFTHEVTRVYDFSYLREFSYHGRGNIEIKQGEKDRLTITTDSELIDHIHISDHRGVLDIHPKGEFFIGHFPGTIKGTLEVKNLSKINLRGSVSVDIDKLQGDQLMINMELEGASVIEGYLDFHRIAVIIEGSSEALLKGNVIEQIIYIDGAGVYLGQNLTSDYAKVYVKGAGRAIVNTTNELDASVVGYGHIHYTKPKPIILKQKVRGEGEITPYQEGMP